MGWSLLPNALWPFKIYCASPSITSQLVLFLWQTVEINPLGHLRVYQICSSESAPFFRRAHWGPGYPTRLIVSRSLAAYRSERSSNSFRDDVWSDRNCRCKSVATKIHEDVGLATNSYNARKSLPGGTEPALHPVVTVQSSMPKQREHRPGHFIPWSG